MSERPTLRCAIYTRKSSDEGLNQAFNSLHAQREACEAYVLSQAGEGWTSLLDHYDDGGFSGATMQRPAMERLLSDIEGGRIDLVIVYKVDRLTRALADFAKLIEFFDKHRVSFVSVTQAFNTTSAMSRLTLNVLLSFAQFEREITGERIRDKVAASKAKGMWMGGFVPLGYDPPHDSQRALRLNREEAKRVRVIFQRYLEVSSFTELACRLDEEGVRSKSWVASSGRAHGGCRFTAGALRHLLRNRIYLGQITHKGEIYTGRHKPIIDQKLFDAVQAAAGHRSQTHRSRVTRSQQTLLNGILFDAEGQPMRPRFSRGLNGPPYQYYVSQLPPGEDRGPIDAIRRVPCHVVDELIRKRVSQLLEGRGNAIWPDELRSVLSRVEIHPSSVHIIVKPTARHAGATVANLAALAQVGLQPGEKLAEDQVYRGLRIVLPLRLIVRGGRQWIIGPDGLPARAAAQPCQKLVRRLRAGHRILRECVIWPVEQTRHDVWRAPVNPHEMRLAITAFLAPEIQRGILSGQVQDLEISHIPLLWADQRALAPIAL